MKKDVSQNNVIGTRNIYISNIKKKMLNTSLILKFVDF